MKIIMITIKLRKKINMMKSTSKKQLILSKYKKMSNKTR